MDKICHVASVNPKLGTAKVGVDGLDGGEGKGRPASDVRSVGDFFCGRSMVRGAAFEVRSETSPHLSFSSSAAPEMPSKFPLDDICRVVGAHETLVGPGEPKDEDLFNKGRRCDSDGSFP